jgi:ribosomal protein L16 Arg81 hydroxylase
MPFEQSDYWNIDDILAGEDMIPCIMKEDAKNLGYLDSLDQKTKTMQKKTNKYHQKGDLKANAKLELPLWLGIALAQRDICELRNPQYLTDKYLDILNAGEDVVNFRNQSCYIYENTMKLCMYYDSESVKTYLSSYSKAFINRFIRIIIDTADSSEVQHNDKFSTDLKKLTNLEREIFE